MHFTTLALSALSIGSAFGTSWKVTNVARRCTNRINSAICHLLCLRIDIYRLRHGARSEGWKCKWNLGLLAGLNHCGCWRYGTVPICTSEPHRHAIHFRSTMSTTLHELQSHWLLLRFHGSISYGNHDTNIFHQDQQHHPYLGLLLARKALPEWNELGHQCEVSTTVRSRYSFN